MEDLDAFSMRGVDVVGNCGRLVGVGIGIGTWVDLVEKVFPD